jgi:hypothetical protein
MVSLFRFPKDKVECAFRILTGTPVHVRNPSVAPHVFLFQKARLSPHSAQSGTHETRHSPSWRSRFAHCLVRKPQKPNQIIIAKYLH